MVDRSDFPDTGVGDDRTAGDRDRSRPVPRRRVLTTIGGGCAAVILAGCLEDDTEAETTYRVVYLHNGERTEVETPEDEAMLYPALDAGVDIPYSCEVGSCGQCTVKYEGDANDVVVHDGNRYLDDDQLAAGWVLTCVAYARHDFELEVAHPDDQ